MKLNGRSYTRRELLSRVGRLEQLGGIRRFAWGEGREAGTDMIEVRTGAGLRYLVSPSRALDISLAEFAGVPLTWQAGGGDVHPSYYDNRGAEWLRTAVGGLVMTCGLSYVGSPGEDAGETFGLHGRVHHLPARHVAASAQWQDDEYEMTITGLVEENRVFGENLRLTRTIHSRLGENKIRLTDEIENAGFVETPLMLLYHCNFGYPLLSEATEVAFPSQKVVARDADVPLESYGTWQAPDPTYTERVYYHEDLVTDENGRLTATIHNPKFPIAGQERPLSVHLSWQQSQLPKLVQWKMPGAGVHVLGIEPANCYVEGRAVERERGTLEMLAPGETRLFELEFSVE
jgi:galactose mutarotase-like enzyme